jgi:hypothetical protein
MTQLKSITNVKSQVVFYTNKIDKELEVTFTPNKVSVSPQGIATSLLQIKASDNAKDRPYTIPIVADISIPTEAKVLTTDDTGMIMNNSVTASLTQNLNLTVTVLPPLRLDEHLSNFYSAWLSPISGIWTFLAGAAAVISPLVIRIYSKKQNKNKKLGDWFNLTK